jgi:hypothetical protein
MAKILFGPLISDARRKIAGVVFSKGHAGAHVRKKTSPCQPRTTAQRTVRANFTANSKAWSGTLTSVVRAGFNSLASTITKHDKLGQAYTPTGAQLYQSTSRNLALCGMPPLSEAPNNLTVSDLGGLTLTEVSTEASPLTGPGIEITPNNHPATGECLVILATAPVRAGVKFIGKSKYRVIEVVAAWPTSPATTFPLDITAPYEAKFGQLKSGQTVAIEINNINTVNGAAGKPYPATITLA